MHKKNILIAVIAAFSMGRSVEGSPQKEPNPAQPEGRGKNAVLTVGTMTPYTELLNLVKPILAAQGIELKIVEFTDYEAPNSALLAGTLDANYYQHLLHLRGNPAWEAGLVPAFGVHREPLGLYAKAGAGGGELKDAAELGIPKDSAGQARALRLLESRGLIALNPQSGNTPTTGDIKDNPKSLTFREWEGDQLPKALDTADAVVLTGTAAVAAGFNPLKDSLIIEGLDSPYIHCVAVKKGNDQDPRITALEQALRSQTVKDYINTAWNGRITAVF